MSDFFVPEFDTRNRRALLQWARDDFDSYDPWGWCMSWLFDVAAAISLRGLEVPPELQYRAGAAGPVIDDDYREEGLAELSDAALIWGARVLNRYAVGCKRAGLDY